MPREARLTKPAALTAAWRGYLASLFWNGLPWMILVTLLLKSDFVFSSFFICVSLPKDFQCLTFVCKVFKFEKPLF